MSYENNLFSIFFIINRVFPFFGLDDIKLFFRLFTKQDLEF